MIEKFLKLNEPSLDCNRHGGCPVIGAQLSEDATNMGLDSVLGYGTTVHEFVNPME